MATYPSIFKITVYDFNTNKEQEYTTKPCDYIQAMLFCDKKIKGKPDMVYGTFSNYALVYYMFKREKLLEQYGIKSEALTQEVLEQMAECMALSVEMARSENLPLAK